MRKFKIFLFFYLLLVIFSPATSLAQQTATINDINNLNSSIKCNYSCNDFRVYKDDVSFCKARNAAVPSTQGLNILPCGSAANKCDSNFKATCCCGATLTNENTKAPLFTIPTPEISIPTIKLSAVNCTQSGGSYTCDIPWIGEYINGIYKYGLNIAGILAALVLMGGGLLWLISGGDASKITQAQNMIVGSITGLMILMSSYILLTQINPDLVKMKSISLGVINKIEAGNEVAEDATTPFFECLYEKYGGSEYEVGQKLTDVTFLGRKYWVNKDMAIALNNAQLQINDSKIDYKSTEASGVAYTWRANVNKPTEQSLHSFGIALDINPSRNPNSITSKKPCQTDIPQGIIDILKNNGFRWGGDYKTVCDAMHFEWVTGSALCKIN